MNSNDICIVKDSDSSIDNNADKKRESRERKAPIWRTEGTISDNKAMNDAIREHQRKTKKKKTNININNSSIINSSSNDNNTVKVTKINTKKSTEDEIIRTTTMSTIPKAPLSNKDKEEEKILERIMNLAALANESHKRSLLPISLPIKKTSVVSTLELAILRSVDECTTLINDWSSNSAQLIGRLCKVYWEEEFTWFYARILNYDSKFNRHYIYYALDSTAEWINFQEV